MLMAAHSVRAKRGVRRRSHLVTRARIARQLARWVPDTRPGWGVARETLGMTSVFTRRLPPRLLSFLNFPLIYLRRRPATRGTNFALALTGVSHHGTPRAGVHTFTWRDRQWQERWLHA